MTATDETEFTELVDADFPRVDLVGKGANGIPRFLIAKQEGTAGLLDADTVRDLISKSEPPAEEDQVTMTGSPAAIAKLIHDAAQKAPADDVAKAEQSTKSQNDLPDSDFAYIESGGKKDDEGKTTPRSLRHFPINDAAHVRNALARASQSPFGDKAMPKIRAAAKKFGVEVSKADGDGPELDEGVDGLDPTVPLAAPDAEAPGDPADPGSPAWEAIDAATAQKWCSILSRAQVALNLLSDRELIEAAVADPDDVENAWDLQDACCAIDYAIGVLAPFAVAEQSEADCGAMAMVGKAMAGFDPAPLDVIEALAQVAKAGRVLSSANEALIRTAGESLQKVLQSLPSAPMADDTIAKQKETAVAADQTDTQAEPEAVAKDAETAPEAAEAQPDEVAKEGAETAEAPAEPAAVAKDGQDAVCAVYDCNGKLVGVVPPDQITPVTGGAEGDDGMDDGSQDDAMVPDPTDMTPAPAADAGVSADDVAKADEVTTETEVAKAADETTTDDTTDAHEVLKGLIADAVAAALDARAPAEDVAKADVAGVLEQVETLKAEVARIGEQPAAPKVFTNGAVPPPGTLRGQDRAPGGGPVVDVAKAAELKTTLYKGTAQEQNAAAISMQEMAIAELSNIHSRRG